MQGQEKPALFFCSTYFTGVSHQATLCPDGKFGESESSKKGTPGSQESLPRFLGMAFGKEQEGLSYRKGCRPFTSKSTALPTHWSLNQHIGWNKSAPATWYHYALRKEIQMLLRTPEYLWSVISTNNMLQSYHLQEKHFVSFWCCSEVIPNSGWKWSDTGDLPGSTAFKIGTWTFILILQPLKEI